jgi:hypothetical protein
MAKYDPLSRYLERLPCQRWTATFAEIEEVLGTLLPPSATRYSAWWANDESPGRQSHAWLDAGFVTAGLNLDGECVTFERRVTHATQPPPRAMETGGRPTGRSHDRAPTPRMEMSDGASVGLVSCVKKKLTHAAAAKDLYISPLFQMSRKIVEQRCRRWFILSAMHGLVESTQVIAPYDKSLTNASRAERQQWSQGVFERFCEAVQPGIDVDLFAGQRYAEFLIPLLSARGHRVRDPLRGLSMGRRLSRLCELTASLGPPETRP